MFSIEGDQIKVKEILVYEAKEVNKVLEVIINRGIYYSFVLTEDNSNDSKYITVYKPNCRDGIQRIVTSIKILEPDNYYFMINRTLGIIALLYVDQIMLYKVSLLTGDPA